MTTCPTSFGFFVVLISLFLNNIIRPIKYILIFSILKQGGFEIVHIEFQMKCRSHFHITVFSTLFFHQKTVKESLYFPASCLVHPEGNIIRLNAE